MSNDSALKAWAACLDGYQVTNEINTLAAEIKKLGWRKSTYLLIRAAELIEIQLTDPLGE